MTDIREVKKGRINNTKTMIGVDVLNVEDHLISYMSQVYKYITPRIFHVDGYYSNTHMVKIYKDRKSLGKLEI